MLQKVHSFCKGLNAQLSSLLGYKVGRPLLCLVTVGIALMINLGFRLPATALTGKLIIKINNVSKNSGIIWIGLYDSADNYLIKEKSILKKIDVTQKGYHEMVIDSLPFGTYAMALFHDVNANGEMDRNLLGIPSEPYAFSKKPKSKWRLPKFDEVKFNFSQEVQEIDTKLKKWWD